MALAEARAAWQRTANRFIIQEDAKRAPKLAPFSSTTVCNNNNKPPIDSGPAREPGGQEFTIAGIFSSHCDLNPSCPNLSSNSRWWLQLQPSYGHQKVLTDEKPNSTQETSPVVAEEPPFDDGNSVKKVGDDSCFDSGRHVPWWRTADTEELASLVAHGSDHLFENCDLPSPRNACAVKDFNFHRNEVPGTRNQQNNLDMNASSTPTAKRGVEGSYKRLRMAGGHEQFDHVKPLSPKKSETGELEDERGKAMILEALRHSQTRAREAEEAAKQAYDEKEHVIKLVLRQATEIFAYKQLIQLLQLENMYFSYYIGTAARSVSEVFPAALPLKQKKTRQRKYPFGKRVKGFGSWIDPVVFALGIGFICAGFLLGWMLPTW